MSSSLLISSREYFFEVVQEGLQNRNIKAPLVVSDYLVTMLCHYLDSKNLFEAEFDEAGNRKPSTLAEMYLTAHNAEVSEQREILKKLADRALYMSGYFGDSLKRKVVDIDYYAELGCSAYDTLAKTSREDTLGFVYKTFSTRFLDFVDVLTYISQKSQIKSDESILRLYERYLKTGSEMAREKLIEMGVVTVSRDHLKIIKQN